MVIQISEGQLKEHQYVLTKGRRELSVQDLSRGKISI